MEQIFHIVHEKKKRPGWLSDPFLLIDTTEYGVIYARFEKKRADSSQLILSLILVSSHLCIHKSGEKKNFFNTFHSQ